MINAIFKNEGEEMLLVLAVDGHAGFSELGTDIVCAAASILVQTLVSVAELSYTEGGIRSYPIIKLDNGHAYIECSCKTSKVYKYMHTVFSVVIEGFRLLAENYPENIDVQVQ